MPLALLNREVGCWLQMEDGETLDLLCWGTKKKNEYSYQTVGSDCMAPNSSQLFVFS